MGQLFSFSGYTGRLGYLGVAGLQLVFLAFGMFMAASFAPKEGVGGNMFGLLIGMGIAVVGSTWIGLAGMFRRVRDMGWPLTLTVVGALVIPFFGLLLLFWPGQGDAGPDTTTFSDDPEPPRGKKPRPEGSPDWMQRALAQVSAAKQTSPQPAYKSAPPSRVSGAMAAAAGPRTEFGLRR